MTRKVHGKRTLVALVVLGAVILAAGCDAPPAEQVFVPETLTAAFTKTPVKIDGVLDDEAWKTATVYRLSLGKDRAAVDDAVLVEAGEARLAWDDTHFYVAIMFHDSDVVAEGKEDQLHHYKLGDLVELFLKPDDQTWYWELYATPAGKKTSFWFPGRGRLGVPSGFEYQCGLRVAATCKGTLNNWQDKDTSWTAEMAMPIKDLTARGEKFAPGAKWRILVSRYNYSRYLSHSELSMTPQLSKTNYHLYEEYGALELTK